MAKRSTFQKFRILLLASVLLFVGADAWLTKLRTTSWDRPLWVVVYPINADKSKASASYISHLEDRTFQPIGRFLKKEIKAYGYQHNTPIKFKLHPEVTEMPPEPPMDGKIWRIILWSLKLRLWAHQVDQLDDDLPEDIRIFVLYYDPATHDVLSHSLGLKEGLIGVVSAYASRGLGAKNNVVIAHELLHTVGATDKYYPGNGSPIFPDGYGEPNREPLHPQKIAEIMGGRIALDKERAVMPEGLNYANVGEKTAREIGWID